MNKYLAKIIAVDKEGRSSISAIVSGAKVLIADIKYLPSNKVFLLSIERTVQLNAGSPMLVEEDNDKRTIISLREIGDGKISVNELEQSAIKRLRKEPDEAEQLEETEEETNDDFENLYKGQISKSGVAVLPSKRTRKITEVKKVQKVDTKATEDKPLELKEEPLELKEEISKSEK